MSRRDELGDIRINSVGRNLAANDGAALGGGSRLGTRNQTIFAVLLPEIARERDEVATRPTKFPWRVDF